MKKSHRDEFGIHGTEDTSVSAKLSDFKPEFIEQAKKLLEALDGVEDSSYDIEFSWSRGHDRSNYWDNNLDINIIKLGDTEVSNMLTVEGESRIIDAISQGA